MPLKIALLKNYLPSCPSPFVVRSGPSEVVEFDRFIDFMAKGRTTLTKTDIVAAMQLFREELQKQLAEGRTVKTPTGAFYVSAAGSMDALDEAFLPRGLNTNHDVRIHHRADRSFEDAVLGDLVIVRDERPDLGTPILRGVQATGSDTPDSLKAGDIIQLRGLRLRFDPSDPNQGLFFIDSGGAETRSPFYPQIKPSSVLAGVPAALASGVYVLALRAAVNGKNVREARIEGVTLGTPAP